MFRSNKKRPEIARQMRRNASTHPLAPEFAFVDAEHDKVKGLKTINLSVQNPLLKKMLTFASMDCLFASQSPLRREFWQQLNAVSMSFVR